MQLTANNLLKALASGVQPVGTPAALPPGIEHCSFADLLKQAREGGIAPKLPVTIDPDSGASLSEQQLADLALAADKAEAAGIRTALVTVGSQRLILDVPSRTITGAAGAASGVLSGIDGLIDLGSGDVARPETPLTPLSKSVPANADIAKLLVELEE